MKATTKSVTVDAIEFTEALGNEIADATVKAVEKRVPYEHKSGITFEVGRGYRFAGSQVSFGDYLVTSHGVTQVMSADDFHATYDLKAK